MVFVNEFKGMSNFVKQEQCPAHPKQKKIKLN